MRSRLPLLVALAAACSNGPEPTRTEPAAAAPAAPASPAPAPAGDQRRAAAEQLFNAAMMAHETGDPNALELVPHAVGAYQELPAHGPDDLYHLALLLVANKRPRDARATAERVLTGAPDHMLALGVAAEAAEQLGDRAGAKSYYQRVAAAFESPRERPEYGHHDGILPVYRDRAAKALGTGTATARR